MINLKSRGQFSEAVKRLRGEVEKRNGKTPEQLYEERVREAIRLEEPECTLKLTAGRLTRGGYRLLPEAYPGLRTGRRLYPDKWRLHR